MIDLSTLTHSEISEFLEAEQKKFIQSIQSPKLAAPLDLPKETQKQLDDDEPTCDSLKLKKHLLALEQQALSINQHNKALLKIVELCDSDKPEVARRACMTILKLSHLNDAPDLYPYDPDYFFPEDDEPTPQRKTRKQKKSPAATAAAVNAAPPATPLNIENLDTPFFDFQQFHLTLPPMNIEDKPSKPHPFHLTIPFITIQSLHTLLIFILILILIPTRFRTTNTPPITTSAFTTHNSELPSPCLRVSVVNPHSSPNNSEFPPRQSLLKYPIRPVHKPERPRMHATPTPSQSEQASLQPLDTFPRRHIGPNPADQRAMLNLIEAKSLEDLTAQTVPASIRAQKPLNLPPAQSESEALTTLRTIASKNKVNKSFLGMGYYGTITPPVILRNVLENPGWYTQYTPYQAEISQGRLEALLNFQTMVTDLTALPMANSSMLDEATAAGEAMSMCHAANPDRTTFFVSDNVHPQTIAVVKSRAKWLGITVIVGNEGDLFHDSLSLPITTHSLCGILLQYPGTDGRIEDYTSLAEQCHNDDIFVIAATDLLALTLIKPPGEWGADIAVGNAQRFGVPMGFGGPHAAFMACKSEFTRKLPGRIVGVSKDAHGNPAYRLALQTREQHIRREKATSNICTAQVLLAIMSSMYAVYHGPDGLKAIARRIQTLVHIFYMNLGYIEDEDQAPERRIFVSDPSEAFDTVRVHLKDKVTLQRIKETAVANQINFREFSDGFGISFDETTTVETVAELLKVFGIDNPDLNIPKFVGLHHRNLERTTPFLQHPVFNSFHAEHEMLRYIHRLQAKDLSLTTSMIPLGSCTMKLNATSEMLPVTWPEFGNIHPFAPADQTAGYAELFKTLEDYLAEITGFATVSLQPNAGSQGEYAGLLAIREYQETQSAMGNGQSAIRDICLIPTSAHGTNPASAVIAGLKVIPVACDEQGNIDIEDLKKKAAEHAANLSCIMITYPSTHGVFEETVKDICKIVHQHGGQVYMDGANMNAQVGLTSPGSIGADVCHLNLHKTFCIPHGGGGPGMGPIGVAKHLIPHLPKHPLTGENIDSIENRKSKIENAPIVISAAPHGSASILPISWMYIRMMGPDGLTAATQLAILNANYMAKRLESHYPILYRGKNGRCAHEFIMDCRQFEETANIKVEDIAKRLMDYGFHAPTMSWPVPGTLMFEPTESESKAELDRLCDAMIKIREEIRAIEEGRSDKADNPLKHAPHTAPAVIADNWSHKYSREQAAYPAPWTRIHKYWPTVSRIDNPYGDRNLVCTCPPMENYQGT